MKKVLNVFLSVFLLLSFTGCTNTKKAVNGTATILYTNDIHGYINNKIKDGDNEVDGLSYANIKALKDDLISQGENVLLVDDGDHAQGTIYSAYNNGEEMIKLMNDVGYDLATLGNHEFDYGQYQAFKLMDLANFDYVSCNFYNTGDDSLVLQPYKVLEAGDLKIAFVGITTPETIKNSTPAYFQDENGNYIYGIYSGTDGQELYDSVQKAIDSAKKEADVVIGLGHLGVEPGSSPYTSYEVIENTTGFDAFIDGHSHTEIEGDVIQDKDGNDVVLTQTKSYLSYIGKMNVTVTDGEVSITTELIDHYDRKDETVAKETEELVSVVDKELDQKIADKSDAFYVNDPETGERIVRKMETNLGDLIADSMYWYFNDYKEMDCDIAVMNAGGIRQDFPDGIYTYRDCKTLQPFGNVICLVKASGQVIKDMLDFSVRTLPDESSIIHVAGMKYSVDLSVEPTAEVDENDIWVAGPTSGEYRVHDIEIYNKETGEYEPIDLEKEYTIGGSNYMLRNAGGGLAMVSDAELVLDYCGEDYMVFAQYLEAFNNSSISTENSPLLHYQNYMIDYEHIYGAGRIVIE